MKTCIIINGNFSWHLCIDGYSINFDGSKNVDYFKKHYKELGYKTTIKNMYGKDQEEIYNYILKIKAKQKE